LTKKKSKWLRRLAFLFTAFVLVVAAGAIFLKSYATPTIRNQVNTPLFTVGDGNYSVALSEGKNIVKFGRLPFGIYPGGISFDNAKEARQYIEEQGKSEEGWQVYLLSGDFELDSSLISGRRHTNKSLLVVEAVTGNNEELSVGYVAFDQTPESGWRLKAEDKRYTEAASMIVDYIAEHPELLQNQIRNLNFHGGQMLAYAHDYKSAKEKFQLCMVDVEPENSPIRWNAYVKATIAFLEQDRVTLETCRAEIAAGPKMGDIIPNLDVVDSLLNHIGESYESAYEDNQGMQNR
jgi:hypothetical protein